MILQYIFENVIDQTIRLDFMILEVFSNLNDSMTQDLFTE